MKQVFGSILIFLMVFALGAKTVTLVHYFYKKQQITAEHCINKDKPELHCEGSCYLSKQLEKADHSSTPNLEYIKDISPFIHNIELMVSIQYYDNITSNIIPFTQDFYTNPYLETLLHPPTV